MSHFIIAGAGHGGLVAARALAQAGHTAEVIERQQEQALGYDWTDVVEPHICSRNGFEDIPRGHMTTAYWNTLIGPSKTAPKRPPEKACREMHVWRKELISHLVRGCRDAGVRFTFGTTLTAPLIEDGRVTGVRAQRDGAERIFRGDMVVDAAGGLSPIRRGLPEEFLVPCELAKTQLFHCWRGFFDRLPGETPEDRFKTYVYHMRRKGLSWVITDDEHMDVLIGSLDGSLTDGVVEESLRDLREDNPLVGTKLLHGGSYGTIPLRRPFAVFVADGYAAVGDSAAMADPFGGSGINIAMNAGSLLARSILEDCGAGVSGDSGASVPQGDYSAKKLWSYQYRFFTGRPPAEFKEGAAAKHAEGKAETDVMKSFMTSITPEEVDLLFERNIISVELVFLGATITPKDTVKLALRNIDKIGLLLKLAKMMSAGEKMKQVTRRIPHVYDRDAIAAWAREYERNPY